MDNKEKIIITNSFGTVTNERIVFNTKYGTEEMGVRDVYSVSFSRTHNAVPAIIYSVLSVAVLVGVYFVESTPDLFEVIPKLVVILGIVVGGGLFLLSMVQFLGRHVLKINEVGDERRMIDVKLSLTKEGRDFAEAIERNLPGE